MQILADPEVREKLKLQYMDVVADIARRGARRGWPPTSSAGGRSSREEQHHAGLKTGDGPEPSKGVNRGPSRRAGALRRLSSVPTTWSCSAAGRPASRRRLRRRGARTLLVERYGFLGGMGTAAGVTNFCGLHANVHGDDPAGGARRRRRAARRACARSTASNEPHLVFGRIHAQAYDTAGLQVRRRRAAARRRRASCCSTRSAVGVATATATHRRAARRDQVGPRRDPRRDLHRLLRRRRPRPLRRRADGKAATRRRCSTRR